MLIAYRHLKKITLALSIIFILSAPAMAQCNNVVTDMATGKTETVPCSAEQVEQMAADSEAHALHVEEEAARQAEIEQQQVEKEHLKSDVRSEIDRLNGLPERTEEQELLLKLLNLQLLQD